MKTILTLFLFIPIWINAQNNLENNAFVKNQGQFDGRNWSADKVEYGIKQNSCHIFFSKKGVTYRFDEFIKNPNRDKSCIDSPKRTNVSELIYVRWINSNKDVEIIAEDKTNHFYSYAVKDLHTNEVTNLNPIFGYKKLTYKNIYDYIDIEYFLPLEGGIKYNVILHPGADPSQIKMEYHTKHTKVREEFITIQLNNKKQIEINGSLGNIIEHNPFTFNSKSKKGLHSEYIFENNILSFKIDNYNNTEEIIIDPWITSTNFNSSGAVWEVETDAYGNIYATGGEAPMELKKYNSNGVLQWTYSTPFDTNSGNWLGVLTTDRQGNSYISQGTAPELERIDSAGNMIWHANGSSFGLTEYWSITFNSDTTQLVVGGTSGTSITPITSYATIYNIDINDGNVLSEFTFSQTQLGSPFLFPQEIRCMSVSSNNQYIYLTHDSIGSIDQDFVTHPTTARTFQVNNNHNLSYKAENIFPNHQNGAPLKALVVNDNYFYTHIGDSICQWSLNDGTLLNKVALPGGDSQLDFNNKLIIKNSGLDVDSCNNVYAGSGNRVVKFDENLNILDQTIVPFIVHDVSVNINREVIAVGAEFNNSSSTRNGKMQAINLDACPQFNLKLGIISNITENNNPYDFNIVPNPFHSKFTINYISERNPKVSVYNIIGELILSETMINHSKTIDLTNQPNGIYFITLNDDGKSISKKIIKQ